ncbi:MAG: sigma-70 family RNA polymerase sigma factor [Bdellovibrionaceae bacterium]|nr:sigma-70 family RNA polymerase sigma factor [Pseudobdellovibrionaceae bacterium]
MTGKATWEDLMVQAQKGNSKMYNQLLTEISQYLTPYLRYKLRSPENVNDLLQDVLLSLHKARHTYEPQYLLKPWLFKIVQSRLIDHFRKVKKYSQLVAVSGNDDLLAVIAEAEISQLEISEFNKALNGLTEDQRHILCAIKMDGKSIKEISADMSLSESAVKVSAHRAYKILFEKLGVEA